MTAPPLPYKTYITIGFAALTVGWLLFGGISFFPIALLALTLRYMGGSINWNL